MLRHYLAQIFPNGFKAQVVAVSREAAIRYKRAFDALLQDVSWLDGYLSELKRSTDFDLDGQKLADLKVEVVISGTANDPPDMHPYTDDSKHEMTIKSFKLPFGKEGEGGIRGDVGIIVVQSMLLTGFDAPVEQVLYLDNVIKEHNLLQAIARVNRVDKNKGCGFVVDYVGVARHLRDALKNFEDRDVEEMLQVVRDRSHELDELAHAKAALDGFLDQYGIANPDDLDACIDVLADDEARNDFLALYRMLTTAMDTALPSPEALKYLADYRKYTFISQTARNRYRDEKFSIRDASAKIREIVEEYLVSKGVDPKIPPIPIFDPRFASRLSEVETPRAKAEELKSAISEYINKHIEEDPELFERFGERLEKLLQEYQQNWNKLAMELEAMLEELRQGREGEENFGLDKKREMPFLGLLKKDVFGVRDIGELSQGQIDMLVQTTKDILENIQREIGLVDFWNNQPAQRRLKSHITSRLLEAFRGDNKVLANRNLLGQKILELAYHIYGNHQTA
jgi:type I restriction enzyme R subunit